MVKRKSQVRPSFLNKTKPHQANPFEHLYSKKKFDVLGRKSKGQTKALRSRSDANEKVGADMQSAFRSPR